MLTLGFMVTSESNFLYIQLLKSYKSNSNVTLIWGDLKAKSPAVEECNFKPLLNTLKLLREEPGLPISSIG